MSAGPEYYELVGIVNVRSAVVIGALQLRQIDQAILRGGLTGER
jgi:hypothetical protein